MAKQKFTAKHNFADLKLGDKKTQIVPAYKVLDLDPEDADTKRMLKRGFIVKGELKKPVVKKKAK